MVDQTSEFFFAILTLLYNLIIIYHRNEAELEYMKIAQDLDMYGINYFEITVSLKVVKLTNFTQKFASKFKKLIFHTIVLLIKCDNSQSHCK